MDCAEILYVIGDPLARRFTEVDDGVKLHVRIPFQYLSNGWSGHSALKFDVWLETHWFGV